MKNKKGIIIGIIIAVIVVVLIIIFYSYLFVRLLNEFGPSRIKTKEEVLQFLAKENPDSKYEVIGSVSYGYEVGSTNCDSVPYLIHMWKVKDVNTNEMHEVYEIADLEGLKISLDHNTIENRPDEEINYSHECTRIPKFR